MIDSDEQVALRTEAFRNTAKVVESPSTVSTSARLATSASSFGSLSMTVMSCPLPLSIFARWLPIFARTRNNDFHTGFTLSAYARIIPGSIFAINNTNV